MKKFFALVIGVSMLASAQGQLFTPEGLHGAVWGGFLGGMIGSGYNHGCHTAEGIAIGASAGYLLGTAVHASRSEQAYDSAYEPVGTPTGYYDPSPYSAGPTRYEPYRPTHAFQGAFLGSIVGGVIGENNHCQGAEGAAIGMGAGLLLGSLADYFVYRREKARRAYTDYHLRSDPATETPAPAAPPPQASTIPARPASRMSGVNALFGR